MFKNYLVLTGTLVFFLIIVPQNLLAAKLTFKVVPNTKTIEVRIDPQAQKLNVVEGSIEFSGPASANLAVQVENGQSILPIWPTLPQYDKAKKIINFTGGVPNGFETEGLLFKLNLSSVDPGILKIAYTNGGVYLNDGKGTKGFISSLPLKIYIDNDSLDKTSDTLTGVDKYKYAIIILLLVILFFIIFKYGIKQKYKH